MSLSDSRRLYVELRDAGEAGLHSHEIRRRGYSGNPSQRCKDIASHGVGVFTARENVGKRPGSRYWLEPFAPDWAVPVRPNGVEADATSVVNTAAPLNVVPAPPDTTEPVATVRDWDGVWRELPIGEDGFPLEEAA